MRHASLLFIACAVLMLGCRDNPLYLPGDDLGVTDLAGADLRGADMSGRDMKNDRDLAASPPPDFSSVDLSARMCFTGTCSQPNCGTHCCASGEWCDNGTCRCGNGNACTAGNMCATAGPISIDPTSCGSICCGKSSPCPL
jgi:hypothetical protein